MHDTWGAHQRMVIARKDITELNKTAPENWEAPESYIRVVHSVFPNLSISAILGGQCLIGFVYPGETSTTTVTRQLILSAEAPATDEEKATIESFSQMTRKRSGTRTMHLLRLYRARCTQVPTRAF